MKIKKEFVGWLSKGFVLDIAVEELNEDECIALDLLLYKMLSERLPHAFKEIEISMEAAQPVVTVAWYVSERKIKKVLIDAIDAVVPVIEADLFIHSDAIRVQVLSSVLWMYRNRLVK